MRCHQLRPCCRSVWRGARPLSWVLLPAEALVIPSRRQQRAGMPVPPPSAAADRERWIHEPVDPPWRHVPVADPRSSVGTGADRARVPGSWTLIIEPLRLHARSITFTVGRGPKTRNPVSTRIATGWITPDPGGISPGLGKVREWLVTPDGAGRPVAVNVGCRGIGQSARLCCKLDPVASDVLGALVDGERGCTRQPHPPNGVLLVPHPANLAGSAA